MSKRVLIVNKFYYPRGGDCVCAINLERMLQSSGYSTAVFSMSYPDNLPSAYSGYFAPEVSFDGGIGNKLTALKRVLGLGDIKKSFAKILSDFKPDAVHFHNIHSYLSPVIVKMAHEAGAKTVWTLHDYKLICPAYSCRCGNGLNACEECFKTPNSSSLGVFTHKCMKGSVAASGIALMEAKLWNRRKLSEYTDAFVCPSNFMRNKMTQAGFSADKTHTICNCVDAKKAEILDNIPESEREDYYVYVGRLSPEKGTDTLLKAAATLPFRLKILGSGMDYERLKTEYSENQNIEFLGHCDAQTVANILSKAKFSVLPSECYENNPLSAIESLYAGAPVIGADIGGIPELVKPHNGVIFKSGDCDSLVEAIGRAYATPWDHKEIKTLAKEAFSPEVFLKKTLELY